MHSSELIVELARRWRLRLGHPPFSSLEINYVAPATRTTDGTRCVLKVSRDDRETRNEIAALQLWNGDGAARLLEADAECGALLLERLEPGTTLVDVAGTDDDSATRIAASVLRRLWRPVSDDCGLRDLASWCAGYDRNRAALSGGAKGFPSALFQRADELRQELLASTPGQMALHGDLHHYNVLWRDSEWVVIDPKGLAGDPAFDVC